MSNFPGERRTNKGPTEEMGGEEALEKTGEKLQDGDTNK